MRAAVRAGVRAIETDVRQTADGQLVICHDAIIRGHAVSRNTYEELKKYEPERPLLSDLLEELAGWCAFNLEIKEAPELAVGEILGTYHIEADTLITSFDGDFLERFNREFPRIKTGILYRMPYGQGRKLHNGRAIGVDVVLPHFRGVDEELVEHAHGLGLEVYAWTVNEYDDLDRLASLGVDGVVTDRYLAFKTYMEENGLDQRV
jgi:glycerophosphoryl diester phosphodiesterase